MVETPHSLSDPFAEDDDGRAYRVRSSGAGWGFLVGIACAGGAAGVIGATPPIFGAAMALGGAVGFIAGRARKTERCSRCVSKLSLGAARCSRCGAAITEDLPTRRDLRKLDEDEPSEGPES